MLINVPEWPNFFTLSENHQYKFQTFEYPSYFNTNQYHFLYFFPHFLSSQTGQYEQETKSQIKKTKTKKTQRVEVNSQKGRNGGFLNRNRELELLQWSLGLHDWWQRVERRPVDFRESSFKMVTCQGFTFRADKFKERDFVYCFFGGGDN